MAAWLNWNKRIIQDTITGIKEMASWLNWNKKDHPRYNYGDQESGCMAQLGIKGKLGMASGVNLFHDKCVSALYMRHIC